MSSISADGLLNQAMHRLRSEPSYPLAKAIRVQQQTYDRAQLVVRAFYAVSLMWVVQQMGSWPKLMRVEAIDPLWPAGWLDRGDAHGGIAVILTIYAVGGLAAALLPRSRTCRLIYFVGLLEYMAVINGFGKVNHNLHAWLFVSFLLVFLPSSRRSRSGTSASRHSYLAVLWSCQVIVLLFYTLTGVWKLIYGVHDLFHPTRVSGLEISGFALIVADRLLQTSQDTLMGEFFVRNQVIGWLLFNGTMYLEGASLLAAFRPRLHRLWGAGLILFHIGTQLAMGFTFIQNIVLVGLLFLCSPWAPDEVSVKDVVLDLPGVHLVANLVRRS